MAFPQALLGICKNSRGSCWPRKPEKALKLCISSDTPSPVCLFWCPVKHILCNKPVTIVPMSSSSWQLNWRKGLWESPLTASLWQTYVESPWADFCREANFIMPRLQPVRSNTTASTVWQNWTELEDIQLVILQEATTESVADRQKSSGTCLLRSSVLGVFGEWLAEEAVLVFFIVFHGSC